MVRGPVCQTIIKSADLSGIWACTEMSKSGGKPEENLKDKLKSLFGLKDKSSQHTFIRQQTKEFIFTPEVLKVVHADFYSFNIFCILMFSGHLCLSKARIQWLARCCIFMISSEFGEYIVSSPLPPVQRHSSFYPKI